MGASFTTLGWDVSGLRNRVPHIARCREIIARLGPQVCGLQGVNAADNLILKSSLPSHGWQPGLTIEGSHSTIAWDKARFRQLESGSFYLDCNKASLAWVELRATDGDLVMNVVNASFNREVADQSLNNILGFIATLPPERPIILLGSFCMCSYFRFADVGFTDVCRSSVGIWPPPVTLVPVLVRNLAIKEGVYVYDLTDKTTRTNTPGFARFGQLLPDSHFIRV
jgi:hypothetical protein